MNDSGRPDIAAELLEQIADDPEKAARIGNWARERVEIGRALFGGDMPTHERLQILAAEFRRMADDDCAGLADPWEDNRMVLSRVADLLDPDNTDVECLLFAHRRAGNPRSVSETERAMIAIQANQRFRRYLAEGKSAHGLKKRVSDEIGRLCGKKGATIEKLWRPLAPDQPLHAALPTRRRKRAGR